MKNVIVTLAIFFFAAAGILSMLGLSADLHERAELRIACSQGLSAVTAELITGIAEEAAEKEVAEAKEEMSAGGEEAVKAEAEAGGEEEETEAAPASGGAGGAGADFFSVPEGERKRLERMAENEAELSLGKGLSKCRFEIRDADGGGDAAFVLSLEIGCGGKTAGMERIFRRNTFAK